MKRPVRCYIASPYSIGSQALNVRASLVAADALLEAGVLPCVPLLSHLWELVSPKPYRVWMEYSLGWLRACDCVLRLPGESAGADEEVREARALGLPVFGSVVQVTMWARAG